MIRRRTAQEARLHDSQAQHRQRIAQLREALARRRSPEAPAAAPVSTTEVRRVVLQADFVQATGAVTSGYVEAEVHFDGDRLRIYVPAFAHLAPDPGGSPGVIVSDGSDWYFVSAAGASDGDALIVDSGSPTGFGFGTPSGP